jgi:hypothetical protein
MATTLELAKQLETLRQRLGESYALTRSVARKQELDRLDRKLGVELVRLISILIDEAGEEYAVATTALKAANKELLAAQDEARRLGEALQRVARALDLVARVVGA